MNTQFWEEKTWIVILPLKLWETGRIVEHKFKGIKSELRDVNSNLQDMNSELHEIQSK